MRAGLSTGKFGEYSLLKINLSGGIDPVTWTVDF